MVRLKVQLKFIEEERKRLATYKKRIAGLKKKASELATLCDVPVLVMSFGPQGQVETWPEDNQAARNIIDRYRELSIDIRNKNELDLPSYMRAEINKHQASFNRRVRDLADMPLLPLDGSDAMPKSLRELAHQLGSRMEAIRERMQLLEDGQHFNGGEIMNMGGQLPEIVPRDGMMGIQNTGSGYDLMASDPYLAMNTSLQYPPQPMSFSSGQIFTDAFFQYPYVPIGMDEVPLATVPSIPMNMDEVPLAMMPSIPMNMDEVSLAMMPSIPTSSMLPLVGPILEYYSANGVAVPVDPPRSSIRLFENHNLIGGGAALQDNTNFVVAQNNVHHLGDSKNGPLIGASPMQTSVCNKPWPFAWEP